MSPTHLITGAGSGIGQQTARLLHDRGDGLVLLARSEQRADELAREFPDAELLVADLADPTSVEAVGRRLPHRLDSVLHIAGVVDLATVADLDQASLRDQLDVNLVAPTLLTSAALPALRSARGTVVFVNSTSGLAANPSWAGYAASKFGLRAIADALRAEEAPHGVRVTTVYPSRTATAMQERVHAQEGAEYDADRFIRPETVAETILHVLDLPRDATIPEVTVRPGPRTAG